MSETPSRRFQARICPACQLRFPIDVGSSLGERCPHCAAITSLDDVTYSTHAAPSASPSSPVRLAALLDNVRSLTNVGSMVRTADGVGLEHIYIGGFTPTLAHPKLPKTALGAEQHVSWSHHPDSTAVAHDLRAQGCTLWALEGGEASMSLFEPQVLAERPRSGTLVLVVGHEVSGVDRRILDQCDRIVHIPMMGHKGSLNVSVAFGIAAYTIRFGVFLGPSHRP